MEEKFLNWWQPNFDEEDAQAVYKVVKSGYINEGEITNELCANISKYLGVKYVIAAPNGTQALYLALKSLGIGKGDEVIVPALTFIATASAVIMSGAKPVFADVNLEDCNIKIQQLKNLISKRTKAILPVHVNGRMADMEEINKIAQEYGLCVIEDAAEAFGSNLCGKYLGTISDVGIISLAPTKIITSGQGGFVLTNNESINQKIVEMKDHGRLSRSWNHHPEIGANFKFNDILAALAISQLKGLEIRLQKAVSDYLYYKKKLEENPLVRFFETKLNEGIIPLWVDIEINEDRESFIEYMRKNKIIVRPFWPSIPSQKPYQKFRSGKVDNANHLAKSCVWLPSGFEKQVADIERVVQKINSYNG